MKSIIGFLIGLLTVIGALAFGLFGFGFILAFPVMWCWDYVMPSLFGLPEITYLQSFVLYFMCGLLFKQTKTIEKEKIKL
jgi:hypothetical protein